MEKIERKTFDSFALVVHSHAVRGYTGNRTFVFPLQLLGRHVDSIEAVQVTCLFPKEGNRLKSIDLKSILQTLPLSHQYIAQGDFPGDMDKVQDLRVFYTFLVSGYMWSGDNLREFIAFVKRQWKMWRNQRTFNSLESLIQTGFPMFVCDPVIGDNRIIYVEDGLLEVYRTEAVLLADIILPNQSELEWICDRTIETIQDAVECCKEIHGKGPLLVVCTSISLKEDSEHVFLLASERRPEGDKVFSIRVPRIDVYLVGCGDFFSSIFLHFLDKTKGSVDIACQEACRRSYVSGIISYHLLIYLVLECYRCD